MIDEIRWARQLAPFVRQTGERKSQTCANAILQQLGAETSYERPSRARAAFHPDARGRFARRESPSSVPDVSQNRFRFLVQLIGIPGRRVLLQQIVQLEECLLHLFPELRSKEAWFVRGKPPFTELRALPNHIHTSQNRSGLPRSQVHEQARKRGQPQLRGGSIWCL